MGQPGDVARLEMRARRSQDGVVGSDGRADAWVQWVLLAVLGLMVLAVAMDGIFRLVALVVGPVLLVGVFVWVMVGNVEVRS